MAEVLAMEIPVPPLVIAGRKRLCTGCTAALPSQPCPRAGDAAGTQRPGPGSPGMQFWHKRAASARVLLQLQ